MAAPRKESIKELILEATRSLLKTHAPSVISLADIASEAGISKGTLYYHYKTKGEIFFDLANRYLTEQWSDFINWTENKEKDTSLRRLVRYVLERNVASPEIRMHIFAEAEFGDEALRQKLIHRYEDFEALISSKIAERTNIPADFLTWLILLVSDGIILQSAIGNTRFDSEAFIEQGVEMLLKFQNCFDVATPSAK